MSRVFRKRSLRGRPSGSSSATFAGDGYRQALATFRTATIDDVAATRCLHARTKTVAALSFNLTWLIRTLHWNLRRAELEADGLSVVFRRSERQNFGPNSFDAAVYAVPV